MSRELPPGYVDLVKRMCQLIPEWYRAQKPAPDLRWLDPGDTLFAGALRGEALKFLADSPDSFRLLEWLDEQTGHEGTIFQATTALRFLGQLPGGPEPETRNNYPKAVEALAFGTGTTSRMSAPQACARCNAALDSTTGEIGKQPKAGDLTVCLRCCALLMFDREMRLRAVTPEELAEFPTQTQDEIASMQSLLMLSRLRRTGAGGES